MLDLAKILEIVIALAAGGVLTVLIRVIVDRGRRTAEARKIKVESDVSLVDVAMRMADKLQSSLQALEAKTEILEKKNVILDQELLDIRISNLNLSREIETLKKQNSDFEITCNVLIRENTNLRVELDNCIKKEI